MIRYDIGRYRNTIPLDKNRHRLSLKAHDFILPSKNNKFRGCVVFNDCLTVAVLNGDLLFPYLPNNFRKVSRDKINVAFLRVSQ